MNTNQNHSSAAVCLAAYSAAVCTLAALLYFPAFYYDGITQNPMAIQILLPVSFVAAGLVCAIRCLVSGKLKRPGRFAPIGALLTGLLTVGLGLATPYRINLLASKQQLLIQTMDLIVSFLSCAAFLFLLLTAALTVYSVLASPRPAEQQGHGSRMGDILLFLAVAVTAAAMGTVVSKFGYSLLYICLGALACAAGILSLILSKWGAVRRTSD